MVSEYFPFMPSYTGVSAICDDLQVTCDPQLALPVAEVVQRMFMESGRSLNLKKCRILVQTRPIWLCGHRRHGAQAFVLLSLSRLMAQKLLGAPIGTETFRTNFVVRRVSKATASVLHQ